MSNELAIVSLEFMQKTIKAKLEQLIKEIDKNFEKAINELKEMKDE